MDLPNSRQEALKSGSVYYLTGLPCLRGHISTRVASSGHCRQCIKERIPSPESMERTKERMRQYSRTPKRLHDSLERARKRLSTPEGRAKHREQVRRSMQRPEAKVKQRESYKRYARSEKGKAAAKRGMVKRRAVKFKAMPRWVDITKVNLFIDNCPVGFHIDHIIPLVGEAVCGLHALENLQYLPAQENRLKSNKIDPFSLEAVVCVLPAYRSY
jgi:hypothetical protein